jgi:hypothetical protein
VGVLWWTEAVGYPHVELAVLISASRDTGHKQLDELAAFLEGFFGVLLDLGYAVSECQEPRFGGFGNLDVLSLESEFVLHR